MPYSPIFKFLGGADPALVWDAGLATPEDPLVLALATDPFVACIQLPRFDWTRYPAALAAVTHWSTRLSNLEDLLHAMFHTVDDAILDSSPFERHIPLDALSQGRTLCGP
jgi:hypothetical protein